LTEAQRQAVLAEARSERFADRSPEYIVTTLLEEGKYHCSIRTLYRLLAQCGETTPRRRQRKHPPYQRPELMATAPNQTWTWDITLLRGPHRGVYYRLYVILDLFSRYTVGWLLARRQYLDARNPVIAIRPDAPCARHEGSAGERTAAPSWPPRSGCGPATPGGAIGRRDRGRCRGGR
jgi:putative transposase